MDDSKKVSKYAEMLKSAVGYEKRPIPADAALRPNFLRDLRKALGMTQSDFWKLVDVKIGTGAKYEAPMSSEPNQRRECPPDVLYRLAKTFDLDWEVSENKVIVVDQDNQDGKSVVMVSTSALQLLEFCSSNNISIRDLEKYVELRAILNQK